VPRIRQSVSFDDQFETAPCYICGGSKGTRCILTEGQFDLPTHVCICRGCGLVFLNPRWTKARYQRFYTSEYDNYYRRSHQSETRRHTAAEIFTRVVLTSARKRFQAVLDIGGGRGEALDLARREYGAVSLNAVEPSLECKASLQLLGATLLADDVDSEWHINYLGAFDLVVMRHVLEHFLDSVLVLQKVASSLSEDGVVYLAVPDMMSPRLPLRNYWFRVVHTYYFSTATLHYTLRIAGLEPLRGLHRVDSEIFCVAKRSRCSGIQGEPPSVYLSQLLILQAFLAMEAVQNPFRRSLPRSIKSVVHRFLAF